MSVDRGSTYNMRTALSLDPLDQTFLPGNGKANTLQFEVKFKLSVSQNVYQIRVIKLKNILEILAEIMGFLAGMSFIARFTKQILVNHRVFSSYDEAMLERPAKKIKTTPRSSIHSNMPPSAVQSPLGRVPPGRQGEASHKVKKQISIRFGDVRSAKNKSSSQYDDSRERGDDFNYFHENLRGVVKK
mmetsp:Transcript_19046/g.18177  ORF Transcript_19046/g.18177 Transcript_19046/m.18177 type:complete len:187 (+) Transcript_19046:199-759(+)